MNVILVIHAFSIMLVTVLTFRYIKWASTLKSIERMEPIRVFIDDIDISKKKMYHVFYRLNSSNYNIWYGKEIGDCRLCEHAYLYPVSNDNGVSHILYSIGFVTGKVNSSLSFIMFIMLINTVIMFITK